MSKQEYQITKSKVELYKFRLDSGLYWADITIDAHGRGGRISIASDWGSWQNYWGAAGDDFKDFLASINFHYAADKFGADCVIDVKESVAAFRKMVLEYRRDEAIDAERARDVWDEIEEIADENFSTIASAVEHTSYLYKFLYEYGDYVDFIYKDNPHFKSFWEHIWPVMLAEFKKEKEAQQA